MSRFQAAVAAACLIIAVSLAWVYLSIDNTKTDALASRQRSHMVLETFAQIIQDYRQQSKGAWPETLRDIFLFDKGSEPRRLSFGFNTVRGGGIYRYHAPPGDNPGSDIAIMASNKAHEAVNDENGDIVSPAAYVILTADFQVQSVDAETHRRVAGWVFVDDEKGN